MLSRPGANMPPLPHQPEAAYHHHNSYILRALALPSPNSGTPRRIKLEHNPRTGDSLYSHTFEEDNQKKHSYERFVLDISFVTRQA